MSVAIDEDMLQSYYVAMFSNGTDTTCGNSTVENTPLPATPSNQRYVNHIAVVIVTSTMMFGALSNGLVFFVIRKRIAQSPFNFLLSVLTLLDFVACVTQTPLDLITLLNTTYPSGIPTCQITGIFGAHTVASSAVILSSVAYFRFSIVCNPHTSTFSVQDAKKVSLLALVMPLMIVWPAVFMYDIKVLTEFDNGYNYYYSDCGISNTMDGTYYPHIFYGMYLIIFLVSLSIMTVCYIRIGKTLKMRSKIGSVSYLKKERIHIVLINIAPIVPVRDLTPQTASRRAGRTKKALVLMVCVTVLFCISFMPHCILVVMYIMSSGSDYDSVIKSNAYSVLFRSYFLNNFLNPLLYGFYHQEFITEMKRTFRKFSCISY